MLNIKDKNKNNRICNNPDCNELGIYPAPKSRENLRDYYYFCIDCIRDFNKSWNYFSGLNEEELEVEIRKSVTWDRPSWKFGSKTLNHDFEKAFKFFDEQKKIKQHKVIDKKLESCFKILELNSDSTLKEIKSRYKMLAKKWHPDVQISVASKNNKDKFISISNAYKTILKTFEQLEIKK
jgi:hypothetical protein